MRAQMRKLKGWALEEPLLLPTDPGAFLARGRPRQAEASVQRGLVPSRRLGGRH
ncbi:hypothetical protein ACRRTK_020487 [Alexandromys fortis]